MVPEFLNIHGYQREGGGEGLVLRLVRTQGKGWHSSQSSFSSYINPISTGGVDYAHYIGTSQPTFKLFRQACLRHEPWGQQKHSSVHNKSPDFCDLMNLIGFLK